MVQLNGQVALITGAGKGVGRELVKALLQEGTNVVEVSRSEQDLTALEEEAQKLLQNNDLKLYAVTGD